MPIYQVYRAASPYNSSELNDLDYEQTADVIYLAHTNHPPGKLIRNGNADWVFSTVAFAPTIEAPALLTAVANSENRDAANSGNAWFPQTATYVVTAYNEDTGQESRASNPVSAINDLGLKRNYTSLSWPSVTGATGYRIYKSENTQLFGHIGTTTSLTFTDDNIGPDLSEGPPIGDNPFALAGDYPGSITFHEQRGCWGRTINRPNAIYFTRSADYENMDFTRPSRADDAFAIGLVSTKVNTVNQLYSFKQGLLALTSHNIFSVQGSNEDYITATPPPRIRPEIRRGSSFLNPIGVEEVMFYETAKSSEIRTLGYEFQIDGVRSNDITIFSRHLFEDRTIAAWDYAEKPGSIILTVMDNGSLNCLTWDAAQEVWGWTTWTTDGLYKGVAVITETGEDRVYFLIQRTINGVTKLYIERMASELWAKNGKSYACYLDCARTYTNTVPISVFDRLDHLEGKTVTAWVDGNQVSTNAGNPLVVTGGSLTLPVAGLIVTIGLPYTATMKTLPLAKETPQGWTVARPQDATKAIIKVISTGEFKAGASSTSLFDVKLPVADSYIGGVPLYTGDIHHDIGGSSGNETTLTIQSSTADPLHVAAIFLDAEFGDVD